MDFLSKVAVALPALAILRNLKELQDFFSSQSLFSLSLRTFFQLAALVVFEGWAFPVRWRVTSLTVVFCHVKVNNKFHLIIPVSS
jgi:hypothetical protein